MNKLKTLLLIFALTLLSCDNNTTTDKLSAEERELVDLLENVTKEGAEGEELDSATVNRILELTDEMSGNWQTIQSEKGNFSIEFPDFEVEKGHSTQLIDGEEFKIYYYSINTQNENDANLGYRIDYSFYPDLMTAEQIKEEFNVQRDFVLSATNSKLEYEYVIDTLDYPGRDILFTVDNSSIKTRYRLFFNEGIFYKLTVITEDGSHFNNSITRFFDSFKILDDNE